MRDFIGKALLTYDFNYINTPLDESNKLHGLLELIKDAGASGYRLMRVVGITVTFLAVLIAAITLMLAKNGRMAGEGMKKLARVVVGICGIFAILGVVAILVSLSDAIKALPVR